jgi:hypothetical protein
MPKAFTVTFTVEVGDDLATDVEYATQVALGLVGAGAVTEDVTVVEHTADGDLTHTVSYLDLEAWAAGGGL